MGEQEIPITQMPRLYDIFELPKIRSVRATTVLRSKIDAGKILSNVQKTSQIKTAKKNVIKFELRRGSYLLLFPSGYVEIRAPNDGTIREVLVAFRDELSRNGLI